jgi:hypothetical protein
MNERSVAEIIGWSKQYLDKEGIPFAGCGYDVDDLLAWLLSQGHELFDAMWVAEGPSYLVTFWNQGSTAQFGGPTIFAAIEAAVRQVAE